MIFIESIRIALIKEKFIHNSLENTLKVND